MKFNYNTLHTLENRSLLAGSSESNEDSGSFTDMFLDKGQWINGYNGVANLIEHYGAVSSETTFGRITKILRPVGEIFLMNPHYQHATNQIKIIEETLESESLSDVRKAITEEKLEGAKEGKFMTNSWTTYAAISIASLTAGFSTSLNTIIAPLSSGILNPFATYLFGKSAVSQFSSFLDHTSMWTTAYNAAIENPSNDQDATAINKFHELLASHQQPFFNGFLALQAIGKTAAMGWNTVQGLWNQVGSRMSSQKAEIVLENQGEDQAPAAPIVIVKKMAWTSFIMTASAFTQVATHAFKNYFFPETPLAPDESATLNTFLAGLQAEQKNGLEGAYTAAFNLYAKDGSFFNSYISPANGSLLKNEGATADGMELLCKEFHIHGC